MRGTGYAMLEIILWMLAAAAIGILLGWILHRWFGGGSAKHARAELEAESARYTKLSSELGDRKSQVQALKSDLADKDKELGAGRDMVTGLEGSLSGVRADLDASSGRISVLETTITALRSELNTADVKAGDLDARLGAVTADRAAEIGRLEARVAGVESMEATLAERDSQLSDLEAKVLDRDGLLAAASAADAANAETVSRAAALQGRVEDLDAELARAREAHAGCAVRDARLGDLEAAAAQPAWQQGETTLGTPGASHSDDLKVVNGIGPKLEGLLNGFGIKAWEQLAVFTPDDVAKVDAALAEFPGRIERDEWVRQARDLVLRFPDVPNRPDRKTYLNESESP